MFDNADIQLYNVACNIVSCPELRFAYELSHWQTTGNTVCAREFLVGGGGSWRRE